MINPQPNYSGVTIQISNPAVNVNPYGTNPVSPEIAVRNGNYAACPQACYCTNPQQIGNYAQAYPAEYYINNYGNSDRKDVQNTKRNVPEDFSTYAEEVNKTIPDRTSDIEEKRNAIEAKKKIMAHPDCPAETKAELQKEIGIIENEIERINKENQQINSETNNNSTPDDRNSYIAGENINIDDYNDTNSTAKNHYVDPAAGISPYKDYAKSLEPKQPEDLTASKTIIGSLDERNAEIKEAKKNTKEQKIVALTDEYIMSLENYLNNPNDEIRLMASKEILTRLDEDKDRYDDAALNALLNKMLQDPSKLIRLAALSAFASHLACGNEYTIQLLQNIQSNPNADKEDALQAADILLKMSAGVEVKNVPASEVKREQYKMKARKTT